MTSRVPLLLLAGCLATAAACGGGQKEGPIQARSPQDNASIATAAIEQAGLPPGFTHFSTGPLFHVLERESREGAFVTYVSTEKETFSVGVSVEPSADQAKAEFWNLMTFGLDVSLTIPGSSAVPTPSTLMGGHHDFVGLPVKGVRTVAIVVQHTPGGPEELASPGLVVAFYSGNVWGRVDVGYRAGTPLERGATDYATAPFAPR